MRERPSPYLAYSLHLVLAYINPWRSFQARGGILLQDRRFAVWLQFNVFIWTVSGIRISVIACLERSCPQPHFIVRDSERFVCLVRASIWFSGMGFSGEACVLMLWWSFTMRKKAGTGSIRCSSQQLKGISQAGWHLGKVVGQVFLCTARKAFVSIEAMAHGNEETMQRSSKDLLEVDSMPSVQRWHSFSKF
jgi:hypothetical protein